MSSSSRKPFQDITNGQSEDPKEKKIQRERERYAKNKDEILMRRHQLRELRKQSTTPVNDENTLNDTQAIGQSGVTQVQYMDTEEGMAPDVQRYESQTHLGSNSLVGGESDWLHRCDAYQMQSKPGDMRTNLITKRYVCISIQGKQNSGDWILMASTSNSSYDVFQVRLLNGAGNDPHVANRILDPPYLSRFSDTFRDLHLTIQRHERHGPWSASWVGEAGGAYNSGSRTVSNTFLNSFWYLDQLGQSAKYDTKVYCRQTFIGGNYGLLDTDTSVPNLDYYSALLWHRLMGNGVLSIDLGGSSYLRAYAHCGKQKGGVALLLINLSRNMGSMVSVRNDLNVGLEKREEYHLTAQDGNPLARTMLLTGVPLELTVDGDIPTLNLVQVSVSLPIYVAPLSIAFVVFPDFEADACQR